MTKRPESGRAGRARGALPALAVLALVAAGPCLAQTVVVTPSLDTRLTWSDNPRGSSRDDGEADWIFELAPGVAVSRRSGRLNGGLSARLRSLAYANDSDRNTAFLALRGSGTFEAVERLLFVDASASVTRNNLSVFAGRDPSDELNVDRADETRVWSVGPRLEFLLGDSARGSVGYLARWVDSGSAGLNDQRLERLSAQLSDPFAFGRFGWRLDYVRSDTQTDAALSRDRTSEVGRATLFVNLSPQLRLRAIAGHESNDYENSRSDSGSIVGAGVDWYPTDRTALAATVEDRIFGRGYDFSLSHRMQRSLWFLSASRDISSMADTLGQALFLDQDCFALVTDPNFRPEVTDPVERAAFVGECIEFSTLRTNAHFLQRTVQGGVSLRGVRNVLSLTAMRSDRSRLSDTSGISFLDDFTESDRIRTTSATVTLNHELSGFSTLNVSLTRSKAEALETAQETKRLLASIGVSTRLGPKTQGSLRYRYQRAEGQSDFTENAVTASVGMRF